MGKLRVADVRMVAATGPRRNGHGTRTWTAGVSVPAT